MTRTHRGGRLPSPEEIEKDDEIDETPAEFYVRHAAEQSDRAAEASTSVQNQRDAEYKLVAGAFALYGLVKMLEAVGDARF